MKAILSVEPIRYPLTGIGRYTLELARHLAQMPSIEELRYYNGSAFVDALPTGEKAGPLLPASRVVTIKRQLARIPYLLRAYHLVTNRRRARDLSDMTSHVYHGPNFYLPPFEGPSVVTIHDLSVLKMPECHPAERVRFMEKEIAVAVDRASHIITVSDFVRHEIADYFSWPLDRVHTTCLGGSAGFAPRDADSLRPVLQPLGVEPGAYALYVGTIEPRKNLERLLAAYEGLAPALRNRYPLILSGYRGWSNDAIMARIRRAETAGWARYLGFVSEEALPHLFAGARLFAFPSLYEGFGLPVLEAMASGVPVVCSNAASLPQVAGEAAAMVDAEDVDALREALTRGLDDEDWRTMAIERGLLQSSRFSWRRCAEETADVYRLAAGGPA